MTIKKCKYCGKIIIENYEYWLEENPECAWIQCNYCFELERIER